MRKHSRYVIALCALWLTGAMLQPLRGEDSAEPAPNQLPVVAISSIPQPEPDPPLQYSLTPNYADLRSGNAATLYLRSMLLMPREKKDAYGDTQSDWLELPLEEFPIEKAREWLVPYARSLQELERATFRESCDWDLGLREMKGVEVVSIVLPEMNELRGFARVLSVRTRLEIAERRFDDANSSLIVGYRMAANAAKYETLISELVGVAIAGIVNQSVIDWIDAGGPNLYWGLAGLPKPLVDIRPGIQQEMNLPLQVFPFLKDPESVSYTPKQWRAVIADSLMKMSNQTNQRPNLFAQTAATSLILAGYPGAKQALIDGGMDAKRIEEMPVGQVLAIRNAQVYRKVYHESIKWTHLPYWQSHRQIRATFEKLRKEKYMNHPGGLPGVLPITSLFLPSIEPMVLAPVRMERTIAALQTIEAIRMATSDAGGQLPSSLSELKQYPPPLDPITGAPFVYKREQNKAILELQPPEGKTAPQFGKRYEVTLDGKK